MSLDLRPLVETDGPAALVLYAHLTLGPKTLAQTDFEAVLDHPGTTVIGAFRLQTLVGMLTLHVLPNVTWGGRPYALIENVITHPNHRKSGVGRAVMAHATQLAWECEAYKIMLLTGQKRGAKGFYEACGFSSEDKHAMVMRRA